MAESDNFVWAALVLLLVSIVYLSVLEVLAFYMPVGVTQNKLLGLLAEFHTLCCSNGLVYWADGGTLLGATRNGCIIAHDDDVDVGMPSDELDRLVHVAAANGYYVRSYLHSTSGIMRFGRRGGDGEEIDVFRFCVEDGYWSYCGWARSMWPNFRYKLATPDNLTEVPFGRYRCTRTGDVHRVSINIPRDATEHCEAIFGTDWFIPRKTHFHTIGGFVNSWFNSLVLSVLLLLPAVALLVVSLVRKNRDEKTKHKHILASDTAQSEKHEDVSCEVR